MGVLDVLLGRRKLRKANREQFFSIVTAADYLMGRTDIKVTGQAGVVFSHVETTFFENLDSELRDLMKISGRATGTKYEIREGTYGSKWLVLDDRDFDDLVQIIHLVAETFADEGFSDRLLAAVFGFEYERKKAYWIYNYKRGKFYPQVIEADKKRDNAAEMKLSALMAEQKVPVERSLEQWYALWDIPF